MPHGLKLCLKHLFHIQWNLTSIVSKLIFCKNTLGSDVFSSPERKAQVSYCHSAPSVRPSSVNFHISTSSPELLDRFWWSIHRPLKVLLFFGQIPPGADPGRDQNRSRVLQETSYSDRKATATNRDDLEACWKKCCYFWFHFEVKLLTRFWSLFRFRHFALF